jgi:hypothetical protein
MQHKAKLSSFVPHGARPIEFSLWKAQKLKHRKVLRASLFGKHDWAEVLMSAFE